MIYVYWDGNILLNLEGNGIGNFKNINSYGMNSILCLYPHINLIINLMCLDKADANNYLQEKNYKVISKEKALQLKILK